MPLYVFSHKDSKTQNWSSELNSMGINTLQVSGNALKDLICIIKLVLISRKKYIYFFRYLNDYNSIFLTIVKLVSEYMICIISFLTKNEVRWIAHNIDRESVENHPRITQIRRGFIAKFSSKVYLTNKYLVKYALDIKLFKSISKKIKHTSFGEKKKYESKFNSDIVETISTIRKHSPNILVGLCATSLSNKCFHLKNIERLMDKINSHNDTNCIMIVVADFKRNNKWNALYERISKRKDFIIYLGGDISEYQLSKSIDFVYRTLSDISVPLTLYNSSYAKIPIVTDEVGFLKDLILIHKVGVVLDFYSDSYFFETFKRKLNAINNVSFDDFILEYNWKNGAKALI